MRLSSVCYAASWLAFASALELKGKITWNSICPDALQLGQARVILDEGTLSGGITRDGSFLIQTIPDGTYLLSVVARDHVFDQLRIDVNNKESFPVVRPYVPGTPLEPPANVTLPYPITLSPREKQNYDVPTESFNVVAMLSNPMMLLMAFAGVMVFAMPYLLKNLDPETLAEFKEQQAKLQAVQSAISSGDLQGGLAIASDEPKTPAKGKPTPQKKSKK